MAEYLSPGVYVEEFELGGKPMEGVFQQKNRNHYIT